MADIPVNAFVATDVQTESAEAAMRREIVEELGIVVVAARLLCLVDQIDVARGRIGSHRSIAPMPSLELRAIWSRRSTTDLNGFRWMPCPMR